MVKGSRSRLCVCVWSSLLNWDHLNNQVDDSNELWPLELSLVSYWHEINIERRQLAKVKAFPLCNHHSKQGCRDHCAHWWCLPMLIITSSWETAPEKWSKYHQYNLWPHDNGTKWQQVPPRGWGRRTVTEWLNPVKMHWNQIKEDPHKTKLRVFHKAALWKHRRLGSRSRGTDIKRHNYMDHVSLDEARGQDGDIGHYWETGYQDAYVKSSIQVSLSLVIFQILVLYSRYVKESSFSGDTLPRI